jgi:hypothetical protein
LTGYSSDEDPVSSDDSELVGRDDRGRGELAHSDMGPIGLMDGFGWDMGGKPRAGGDGRGNGRSAHSGAGCVTKDGFGRNTGGELG